MLKNITQVKLGDDKCNLINDFKIKQIIIDYLFNNIDTSLLQEHLIEETNILKIIKNKKYKAIYLTNFNNYILLLKEIDNTYYTLLIKNNFNYNYNELNYNKLEIYFIDMIYPKDYYKGTIINGHLEIIKNNSIFNIYDILKFKGDDINYDLDEKKDIMKLFIKKTDNKYFKFDIVNYIDFDKLENNSANVGILFIPYINDNKYIIYFDTLISKQYCNLYMKKKTTDVFSLYCLDNTNKKYKIGIAHIPNLKTSRYFNNYQEDIIVKCWYDIKFSKWVPFEILEQATITSYDDIIIKTKRT